MINPVIAQQLLRFCFAHLKYIYDPSSWFDVVMVLVFVSSPGFHTYQTKGSRKWIIPSFGEGWISLHLLLIRSVTLLRKPLRCFFFSVIPLFHSFGWIALDLFLVSLGWPNTRWEQNSWYHPGNSKTSNQTKRNWWWRWESKSILWSK